MGVFERAGADARPPVEHPLGLRPPRSIIASMARRRFAQQTYRHQLGYPGEARPRSVTSMPQHRAPRSVWATLAPRDSHTTTTVTRAGTAFTRHHPGHDGLTPACLSETLDRQRSPEVNLVCLMRLQHPARRRLLLQVTIGTHPDDDASGSEGLVGKLVQLRLIRKNRFHLTP
jgi:hypothetical protein